MGKKGMGDRIRIERTQKGCFTPNVLSLGQFEFFFKQWMFRSFKWFKNEGNEIKTLTLARPVFDTDLTTPTIEAPFDILDVTVGVNICSLLPYIVSGQLNWTNVAPTKTPNG